jgi:hypothetical protein
VQFEFGLKFRIGANADLSEIIERLKQAGCKDAVVGLGRPGRLAMEFARDGASLGEAIRSAVLEVQHAIPGVELVEIQGQAVCFDLTAGASYGIRPDQTACKTRSESSHLEH